MERKRGRRAWPVPADFEENAAVLRNAELMKLYGVGKHVIKRWRRETGLRGNPFGARFSLGDSPEEIRACLTCPVPGCAHGDCDRRKRITALAGGGK